MNRQGMDDCVTFLGYQQDIRSFFSVLDIFVLSSRWEGLGLVLLEAMAGGKPIVATCAGAIPEVVPDGQAGLLVPVDDQEALARALERLAGDAGMRKSMGDKGRKHVEREFPLDRMVDRIMAIYEDGTAFRHPFH